MNGCVKKCRRLQDYDEGNRGTGVVQVSFLWKFQVGSTPEYSWFWKTKSYYV